MSETFHRPHRKEAWRRARAFTLIELIVVILILGILALVATVGYANLTARASATAAQSNLRAVSDSLIAQVALEGGGQLDRDRVSDALGDAFGTTVVDGVAAAETRLGLHDDVPGDGEYAVGFSGATPDVTGQSAVLLAGGGGKVYATLLTTSGQSAFGLVPEGATPSDVLLDPELIGSDAPLPTVPAEPEVPAVPDVPEEPEIAPAAPAGNVKAASQQTSLTVTWSGDAVRYTVSAVPAKGATLTCETTSAACTLTGAEPNTSYQVTVSATHGDGRTATSAPLDVLSAPAVPTGLTYFVTTTAFWTPSAGAMGYIPEVKVAGGGWVELPMSMHPFIDLDDYAGSAVTLRVSAMNAQGAQSAPSAELVVPVIPSMPKPTAVMVRDGFIDITWPAVPHATSYTLSTVVNGKAGQPTTVTSTSAALPIAAGQSIRVYMTATGPTGVSDPVDVGAFTRP